jgi:hypothetical protein
MMIHIVDIGALQPFQSAYVANVLENKAAVLEKLPSAAAYLNHLDDSQEELDATRFGSVEMEKYVEVFRAHMLRIKDTASRDGVDIVEKLPSRLAEKKLQFLFSKALMQARVNQPVRTANGDQWHPR